MDSDGPVCSQTAAWGTLGTLRTCLNFSVDKDVQRLLRAIAGPGEPCPSAGGKPQGAGFTSSLEQ